ncbi:hypothetical protein [Frondihabitans cladoniiphilus]|uniref:Uncharacterized protein n=1 Tax=Frondihabitans cladoniiphilus TaxID=715785 RepID=A0ABP8VMT3_9MICO
MSPLHAVPPTAVSHGGSTYLRAPGVRPITLEVYPKRRRATSASATSASAMAGFPAGATSRSTASVVHPPLPADEACYGDFFVVPEAQKATEVA